jgi:threonine dehydrogenase-like Zn-dependent dehydrogenase
MRAAVVSQAASLEVVDLPVPRPAPGQARVRVAACGICGSDPLLLEHAIVAPGTILGHEVGGVVEDLNDPGPTATPLAVGDAVAILPTLPCGSCRMCAAGTPELCPEGLARMMGIGGRPGGLAEHVVVDAAQLVALGDGVDPMLGALAQPLAVSWHGVTLAEVRSGERVAVLGGGSIGVMAALALRASGADEVVVSQRAGGRRDALERMGFTVVDPAELPDRARDVDVVLECSGSGEALAQAIAIVRGGGRVVLLGLTTEPLELVPAFWVWKEITLRGAFGYGSSFPDAVAAIVSGAVPTEALTAFRIGLDAVAHPREVLAGAGAPKVLVEPWRAG